MADPLLLESDEGVDTVENSLVPVSELETENLLSPRGVDVALRDGTRLLPHLRQAALELRARLHDVSISFRGRKPLATQEEALPANLGCGRGGEGQDECAGDVAHVDAARVHQRRPVAAKEVVKEAVGAESRSARLRRAPFRREGAQEEGRVHCDR